MKKSSLQRKRKNNRYKLWVIHGTLTEVPEHEDVDVIHLLKALHHNLELYEVTKPM